MEKKTIEIDGDEVLVSKISGVTKIDLDQGISNMNMYFDVIADGRAYREKQFIPGTIYSSSQEDRDNARNKLTARRDTIIKLMK